MVSTSYVRIQDDNTNCTGNAPFCMKAPSGWTGKVGDGFNRQSALAAGFVEDVGCVGYLAATDCGGTGNTGGSGGTGGVSIEGVGIQWVPGSHVIIGVATAAPLVGVRITNQGTGVSSEMVESTVFGVTLGGKNFNRAVTIRNVPAGTYTILVQVINNDQVRREVKDVVLGTTYREAALYPTVSEGTGTTPNPNPDPTPNPNPSTGSATLSRGSVQYNPGSAFFVMAQASRAPQMRVVSNGFDSNWITGGEWSTIIDNESYNYRAQIPGIPNGTHRVQFRFEGGATLADVEIVVDNSIIRRKVYPTTASIDAIGMSYVAGSHAFVSVNASGPVEVRIISSSFNSGYKAAENFGVVIDSVSYSQRAYIGGIPASSIGSVEVQVIGTDVVRRVNDISFGASSRTENLFPATGGSGSCSIAITDTIYDYTNNRLTAVVSSSGLKGSLQYSLDQTNWKSEVTQIASLIEGSYTLYVQDSENVACKAQRGFAVGCVKPAKNLNPVITVVQGAITALDADFGTSGQTLRYVIINTNSKSVIWAGEGKGGTVSLPATGAYNSSDSYTLSVQIPSNLTCETVVPLLVLK